MDADGIPEHWKYSQDVESLITEVAAIEALGETFDDDTSKDEDINIIQEGKYRDLLAKYPELLKQNFSLEATKSDVVHTGSILVIQGQSKPGQENFFQEAPRP